MESKMKYGANIEIVSFRCII